MQMNEPAEVSESERAAVEAALLARFGAEKALAVGASGNSPYSPATVVYGPEAARERGCRVALAAVCESYDGAGHYKGRGSWRTVYVVAQKPDGTLVACKAGDRDAQEVGSSGFYLRPWAVHEAEEASGGLGLGASAMADALKAVGL